MRQLKNKETDRYDLVVKYRTYIEVLMSYAKWVMSVVGWFDEYKSWRDLDLSAAEEYFRAPETVEEEPVNLQVDDAPVAAISIPVVSSLAESIGQDPYAETEAETTDNYTNGTTYENDWFDGNSQEYGWNSQPETYDTQPAQDEYVPESVNETYDSNNYHDDYVSEPPKETVIVPEDTWDNKPSNIVTAYLEYPDLSQTDKARKCKEYYYETIKK